MSARLKGLYVIGESGALYPSTGASHHINVGIEQLSREFDIEKILFCELPKIESNVNENSTKKNQPRHSAFRRFSKWIFLLVTNHLSFFSHYRVIKDRKPNFIYERASYLNYNGILISKLMKVPHFYEVNGILANDNSKYFPNVCNKWAFNLEKRAYNAATFGFYVGGLNRYFNISREKYLSIQNGVDEKFAELFSERKNVINEKSEIAFIGSAMDHHRLDLLAKAINGVANPSAYRLSLVGFGLEKMETLLHPAIERRYYGSLTHQEIARLITGFNLAIIPHALDYFSHVKVFMYGAAKLLLILPRTINFESIFNDNEVIFVENGNASAITSVLNSLQSQPEKLEKLGNNIYEKVSRNYTWEKIYGQVSKKIKEQVESFNAAR